MTGSSFKDAMVVFRGEKSFEEIFLISKIEWRNLIYSVKTKLCNSHLDGLLQYCCNDVCYNEKMNCCFALVCNTKNNADNFYMPFSKHGLVTCLAFQIWQMLMKKKN